MGLWQQMPANNPALTHKDEYIFLCKPVLWIRKGDYHNTYCGMTSICARQVLAGWLCLLLPHWEIMLIFLLPREQ